MNYVLSQNYATYSDYTVESEGYIHKKPTDLYCHMLFCTKTKKNNYIKLNALSLYCKCTTSLLYQWVNVTMQATSRQNKMHSNHTIVHLTTVSNDHNSVTNTPSKEFSLQSSF